MPVRARPEIAMVGTFDVANFGDLLFPMIAEYELGRRLGDITLRRFSHRPMVAPPWPYRVEPLDDLTARVDELDLVIVGGGHLVRFDDAVAPGYESTASSVPHPTGYWLVPPLLAAASGIAVAWNAVGSSVGLPHWAHPLIASTLEAADYVSVRDSASLSELGTVAPSAHIRLVPDTAFGVASLLRDRDSRAARHREPRGARPYIIVQPSRALQPIVDTLRHALVAADAAGLEILELPVSPVLGDRIGLLGDLGVELRAVDPWPEPVELARLIAGAEAVVVHSLHASTVALAHGIPVHRPAAPEGTKYHRLASLPGVSLIQDPDQLGGALVGARRSAPSTQVTEMLAQLEVHWDTIADLLTSSRRARSHRVQVARRLLSELPAMAVTAARDAESHSRTLQRRLQIADDGRRDLVRQQTETVAALASTSSRAADLAGRIADLEASMATERRDLVRQQTETVAALASTSSRAADLAGRIIDLEATLAKERSQAATDRRRADLEVERMRRDLADAQRELRSLRPKAAMLDRLRRRLPVRAALGVRGVWRRSIAALRHRRSGSGVAISPRRPGSASVREARDMRAALARQAPGSVRIDGPLVSVIVLNRDGVTHLRRLVDSLVRTTYRTFELIVVDNGSSDDSIAFLASVTSSLPRLKVIRNSANEPFADANNAATRQATGELLLFLNNDVEPVVAGWLGRLVDTLESSGAAAVGARLVYPRREALDNAGDSIYPDLTLQHRGIDFAAADGVPTGKNLGSGSDPLSQEASATRSVPGATAACLLVRREVFDGVGGFTTGYVYGTEDVDLALKLRAAGHTIVYDGGAALWHHEYGTQNAQGREWKRHNRTKNRQLFVDRWAPQVFREVFRDRVLGQRRWSESPLRVAITLTRDDPAAGWGDYFTAHELGDALVAIGWDVVYVERHADRWYSLDASVDVVVALLDSFDIRRIPGGIVTVAWIRNWTDRWVGQPWFDEYDIVLASSGISCDVVRSRTTRVPRYMALATNPERFTPRPAVPELRADLVFVGNSWGVDRAIQRSLPAVAGDRDVAVYGRGWGDTALASFHRGIVEYDVLPAVYASARVVIDDTAGPTLPYGAVNGRVFDALAAGALVVTDNPEGARELFGDNLPVASDPAELEAILRWIETEPEAAAARQAALRKVVLERHTYAHRARELRGHLLEWVNAERYAILAGVPSWDEAPSWGDYHFARDVQRQLERAGHPARTFLLGEWGRAPAARADVVIHLHGLSDHRARPSQANLLWLISHPERISPAVLDRYDAVFVASDMFADGIRDRVRVPVIPLHQATDPERFRPEPGGQAHELLFVGNTRGVRRPIVDEVILADREPAIYGKGWTPDKVDPRFVHGDHIDNRILNQYYSAAAIVLNDHWPEMRANGFIANRIYDALASGAFVLSDYVAGIENEFDGGVVTYTDREELRHLIARYVADPDARLAVAERGRAAVLARHTFARRVAVIVDTVAAIQPARPGDVSDLASIEKWLDRRRRRASGDVPVVQVDRQAVQV